MGRVNIEGGPREDLFQPGLNFRQNDSPTEESEGSQPPSLTEDVEPSLDRLNRDDVRESTDGASRPDAVQDTVEANLRRINGGRPQSNN